jgi:hypothetical protein
MIIFKNPIIVNTFDHSYNYCLLQVKSEIRALGVQLEKRNNEIQAALR